MLMYFRSPFISQMINVDMPPKKIIKIIVQQKPLQGNHWLSVVLMETLINLILWWVTLIPIVSDSQPDLEKKKVYQYAAAAKLRYIIYIPKKWKHQDKIKTVPMVLEMRVNTGAYKWQAEVLKCVPEWVYDSRWGLKAKSRTCEMSNRRFRH